MNNVSKARRNVITHFGMWAVVLCMAAGLVMNMRPLVILERAIVSVAISAMLGYVLVSVIDIYSKVRRKPLAKKPVESSIQEAEANNAGVQDESVS